MRGVVLAGGLGTRLRPLNGRKGPYWEVDKRTGCWNWLYACQKRRRGKGYGWKAFHGRMWLAHRWVWLLVYGWGPDPYKWDLHHKCDNLRCVNPKHLKVVTHAKNVQLGKASKLSWRQVRDIRRRYRKNRRGHGSFVLAKTYGVSKPVILAIIHKRTWREE